MAYQFIRTNQNRYAIKERSGLLGVSRSAYYKWLKAGVSNRRHRTDAELVSLIGKIAITHHRRYGKPTGASRTSPHLRETGKFEENSRFDAGMRYNLASFGFNFHSPQNIQMT